MPFSKHTEIDHNEWNYIFFLAYLKRKDETEYTGLESYVRAQIDRGEINWIPNRRAMAISPESNSEEAESVVTINLISERLKQLENQVIEIKMKQNTR